MSSPPPSYDDVVPDPNVLGTHGSPTAFPSAPPLSDLPPPSEFTPSSPYGPLTNTSASSEVQRMTFQDTPPVKRALEVYVRYSVVQNLRRYMAAKSDQLDPELDVEAQFSRRAVRDAQSNIKKQGRLRCYGQCLWGLGVTLIGFYVVLPIAMLAIGALGFSHCSYKNGSIIIYLLLGGALLLGVVCTRSIPSCMTCCKNKNRFNTQDSFAFTSFICIFEVIFYLLVVGSIAILLAGSSWIFHGTTPICSKTVTEDCCSRSVYASSAFFNVFQYLLYLITLLYASLIVCFNYFAVGKD